MQPTELDSHAAPGLRTCHAAQRSSSSVWPSSPLRHLAYLVYATLRNTIVRATSLDLHPPLHVVYSIYLSQIGLLFRSSPAPTLYKPLSKRPHSPSLSLLPLTTNVETSLIICITDPDAAYVSCVHVSARVPYAEI